MKKILLNDSISKIHFIGIGGISMSGLAELMHKNGYIVSGSDWKVSDETKHLEDLGIKIYLGNKKSNIKDDISLVVYTAAVKEDNEELAECRRKKLAVMDRAHFMGQVMKNYKFPISIAGMHGKTTTTSIVSEIFLAADKDPTISVGAYFDTIKGNMRIGNSEYFIVETCEYCDSFLHFFPHIGIILNIEEDHLDYFKDINHIENSFKKFANNIDDNGALVIHSKINNRDYITEGLKCRIITYGSKNADWYAENIKFDENGYPSFEVFHNGAFLFEISLHVQGKHNVDNTLAAIACAEHSGLALQDIINGAKKFTGSKRRFEYKGNLNGLTIIDDYAHHPTEIKATLSSAKNSRYNKVYCAFQPHTYTRTKALFKEFSEAFDSADEIIILDIYSAREKDTGEVHSKDLVEAINKRGKPCIYMENFETAKNYLIKKCIPSDLLITMGAGDVYLLANEMLYTGLSTNSTVSTGKIIH